METALAAVTVMTGTNKSEDLRLGLPAVFMTTMPFQCRSSRIGQPKKWVASGIASVSQPAGRSRPGTRLVRL